MNHEGRTGTPGSCDNSSHGGLLRVFGGGDWRAFLGKRVTPTGYARAPCRTLGSSFAS